jgi:hypothetical protein
MMWHMGKAKLTATLLALGGMLASEAQASYTVTISEVGAAVVASGSGTSLDLTAFNSHGTGSATAGVLPISGYVAVGVAPGGTNDAYCSLNGPNAFGSGNVSIAADTATGVSVGIIGVGAGCFYVPTGYVSGAPLGAGTATWSNQTIAGMNMTPGTYQWTWGSGATADSFTVIIQGAAGVPTASGSPNPFDLGASTVGNLIPAQTETITNTGNATLTVGTASISGVNAGDFTITADTCSGASLAPAATCTVALSATPTAAGHRNANLSVPSNDPASPLLIPLTITGYQPPTASPSANPLAFGAQAVASTSAPLTETITNTGIAHLSISTVTPGGANSADFTITADTCAGASLAPGATCTLSITFSPGAAGARNASVSIASNDPAGPLVIALAGNGVSAGPTGIANVPTLSEWGLILLSLLMAWAGMGRRHG